MHAKRILGSFVLLTIALALIGGCTSFSPTIYLPPNPGDGTTVLVIPINFHQGYHTLASGADTRPGQARVRIGRELTSGWVATVWVHGILQTFTLKNGMCVVYATLEPGETADVRVTIHNTHRAFRAEYQGRMVIVVAPNGRVSLDVTDVPRGGLVISPVTVLARTAGSGFAPIMSVATVPTSDRAHDVALEAASSSGAAASWGL